MPQNFEIRVLSLPSQLDRREKIDKIFEKSNFEWSFFNAISGENVAPFLNMYDRKKRLKNLGYDLKQNEIACFISHREIWKECSVKEKNFLILEDDIKIKENLSGIFELKDIIDTLIERVGKDFLFARIGNLFERNFSKIISISSKFDLVRYRRDPSTAMGYLISPKVAEKLLAHSEFFFTAVDDFMWRGWQHNCCLFDIYPNLLFTSDLDTPSNIGDRSKPKLKLSKKISREYFRMLGNIERSNYERKIIKKINSNEFEILFK